MRRNSPRISASRGSNGACARSHTRLRTSANHGVAAYPRFSALLRAKSDFFAISVPPPSNRISYHRRANARIKREEALAAFADFFFGKFFAIRAGKLFYARKTRAQYVRCAKNTLSELHRSHSLASRFFAPHRFCASALCARALSGYPTAERSLRFLSRSEFRALAFERVRMHVYYFYYNINMITLCTFSVWLLFLIFYSNIISILRHCASPLPPFLSA